MKIKLKKMMMAGANCLLVTLGAPTALPISDEKYNLCRGMAKNFQKKYFGESQLLDPIFRSSVKPVPLSFGGRSY